MKKKGFTLIELLAVIVILAIIALIATPIVMSVIENSRKGAAERSAENHLSSIETAVMEKRMDGEILSDGTYDLTALEANLGTLEISGQKATEASIIVKDGQVMDGSTLKINNYVVNIVDGTGKVGDFGTIIEDNNVIGQTAGTPTLTYNPKTGVKGCTQDNTSCFGWYVLEDKGPEYAYVSLIMDRNFTDEVVPSTLAWCTDGGHDATCQNINSTEVNPLKHIQDTFGDSVEVSFPTKDQIASANNGSISNLPQWLYDYLNGTPHPVSGVFGYWTASPRASFAWSVGYTGYVGRTDVDYSSDFGVRPVITISKSLID